MSYFEKKKKQKEEAYKYWQQHPDISLHIIAKDYEIAYFTLTRFVSEQFKISRIGQPNTTILN